jgi:hypothetical protein
MGTAVSRPRSARNRKKTPRLRRFFAFYGGESALDGTDAARRAGYAWPEKAVARLRETWPEEFERVEDGFRDRLKVGWDEAQEIVAAIARDPKHKDRIKAVELIAKLHGKLDPKIHVAVDRTTVEQHLQDLLQQMARNKLAAEDTLPLLPPATTTDGS